ncbi:hypothetical protein [Endozoicomonas arenosclerae]|uniref:hypothetical protein n=1 Tax=Endozoicomonas arenosclerae TaxID=1633495 RepID=UPI00078157D6|nr:hypothetical protein [Endozoicomonas arenosclerae]
MATTNIWQQFKSLIPEGAKTVATVVAKNSNSTSQVRLRDGSVVTVQGMSVDVGQKAIIQGGVIKGSTPELAQYESEV